MTNNKKGIKKVLTEQEEEELNELADIFVEALLYELKTEQGLDPENITFESVK